MNEEYQEILELMRRRLLDDETPEGKAKLDAWLKEDEARRAFFERTRRGEGLREREELFAHIREAEALKRYDRRIGYRPGIRLVIWLRACAAIAVVAIGAGLWLWQETPIPETPTQTTELLERAQVRLRLASGEEISLTKEEAAQKIFQGEGVTTTNQAGNLIYADNADRDTTLRYNELLTPKGCDYRVTLADGSRVWLSTFSRLRYPVAFHREERIVYLEGEAYFEVAMDSARPFIVRTEEASVRVYGTEFNVKSRDDGQLRTVLVKGSVGVTIEATGEERMLRPNQLLTYDRATGEASVQETDVYPHIAWRFNEFAFYDERMEDVMEELSQWYDTEVFYTSEAAQNTQFTGIIPRFEEVGKVLYFIEETGTARFHTKGKTITVSEF